MGSCGERRRRNRHIDTITPRYREYKPPVVVRACERSRLFGPDSPVTERVIDPA